MSLSRSASRASTLAYATTTLLFGSAFGASTARAQTGVQLTLGGFETFGVPTAADFAAGILEASTPLPFQVLTTSEPAGSITTSVYIRSSSPTLGAGKSVTQLEWRRGDDPTWRAVTTVDAIVETRVAQGTAQGHTWSNTIHFRMVLRWASDRPTTYASNLVLTVSTTAP